MKTSQNKIFRVVKEYPYLLGVHEAYRDDLMRHSLSQYLVYSGRSSGRYDYYQYTNIVPFINDCLQFAENLAVHHPRYDPDEPIFTVGGHLFGNSDRENMYIGRHSSYNTQPYNADPQVGEAYALVRLRVVDGEAPYHIASVIAKDGYTNITIEADAGEVGSQVPAFDMYDTITGTSNSTFYKSYVDMYSPAGMLVLQKRDDADQF